jgi:ubiquinone/menaquinone biosynthesis C-methylase UbiE
VHSERATRATYDAVAETYAQLIRDMSLEAPLDRAVLTAFVEMLGDGLVLEVGCGTGRVMARLQGLGIRIAGVDLSPGMLAVAHREHPGLAIAAADARALPVRAAAVSGLVAWYSLINLPTTELPEAFREFARVTTPGSPVLIAFQCGDGERVDNPTAYGLPVPLTYHRHRIDDVADLLAAEGFRLHATVRREPHFAHESTPQAFLLAQR